MKQKGLTQKIVREYVRLLGGTFKATGFGDFRIKFGESDYHANDLLDVIETARAWQGTNENIESAEQYLSGQIGETRKLCAKCGAPMGPLEVFPGGICLKCHAEKVDQLPLEKPDFIGAINRRIR